MVAAGGCRLGRRGRRAPARVAAWGRVTHRQQHPGLQIRSVHGLPAVRRPREDDDLELQREVDDNLRGSRQRHRLPGGLHVAATPQNLAGDARAAVKPAPRVSWR